MSNITASSALFSLSVGTKKAPKSINAPRAGVALTMGRNGKDARAAEKNSLPHQALNGNYATFAGYIMASFPKVCGAHFERIASHAEALRLMSSQGIELSEAQVSYVAAVDRGDACTRMGFDMLIQCIIVNVPAKLTKAQVEALDHVNHYVTLSADRAAKRDAEIKQLLATELAEEQPLPTIEAPEFEAAAA